MSSSAGLSTRLERAYDRGAALIKRHPRKWSVFAFFFIFLPQRGPSAKNAAVWIWSYRPGWIVAMSLASFSWNWVTVPCGLVLLALIWWETRKGRSAQESMQLIVLQAYPDRNIENTTLKFPLKLRVQLSNNFGEAVSVRQPKWIRGSDGWPPTPPTTLRMRRTWKEPDQEHVSKFRKAGSSSCGLDLIRHPLLTTRSDGDIHVDNSRQLP